ncbi:MAG: replication initiation protein [Pseudomonadota bacterium]
MTSSHRVKTLDLRPDEGQMIKPTETIDVAFAEGLSLNDRRCWNALIANAFGPDMRDSERDFKIDIAKLRDSHLSNDRVEDTIEKLMRTIARCRMPDGSITRFQLLGGNNMGDPTRPRGELTYSFDKRLIAAVKDSISFGKLEIAVMAAFNSKYALALYEHVSRRINLKHVYSGEYTVDELREVLDVQPGQLKAFGNLKQRAIAPALSEVNLWAPFTVSIAYKKSGQRVSKIVMNWFPKDVEGRKAAYSELEKHKAGRKARSAGVQETVVVMNTAEINGGVEQEDMMES